MAKKKRILNHQDDQDSDDSTLTTLSELERSIPTLPLQLPHWYQPGCTWRGLQPNFLPGRHSDVKHNVIKKLIQPTGKVTICNVKQSNPKDWPLIRQPNYTSHEDCQLLLDSWPKHLRITASSGLAVMLSHHSKQVCVVTKHTPWSQMNPDQIQECKWAHNILWQLSKFGHNPGNGAKLNGNMRAMGWRSSRYQKNELMGKSFSLF